MDVKKCIGVDENGNNILLKQDDIDHVKIQLLLAGFYLDNLPNDIAKIANPIMEHTQMFGQAFFNKKCSADGRIEKFLSSFLRGIGDDTFDLPSTFLPKNDFICDRYGTARILSIPENSDEFHSEYVESFRTYNGILHNPATDKRTTKDVFHIVESDIFTPLDKKEVPKLAFAKMLYLAFHPTDDMLTLPFTALQSIPIKTFASCYLKPVVCPAMPGIQAEKRMEIRFFVPGSLVSVLDCMESIFGNTGSPGLPTNDAALDPISWTGHTGCIVFAPQLRKCTKKILGLPHVSQATERQKRDGMCWSADDELYHDGKPFKIVARDSEGVIVSIVADSYNGYGKKEIKTHISYSANMLGVCEEEHSGGTLVFQRYDLGDEFSYTEIFHPDHRFDNVITCCKDIDIKKSDGFAIDKNFNNIIYVPEFAKFSLPELTISWMVEQKEVTLALELGNYYILPSGYRVTLEKPDGKEGRWKMVGMWPDGIFCYKPATVSGGGKSEIAKNVSEFISSGPTIIFDYDKDFSSVKQIVEKDFSDRFKDSSRNDHRKLLSNERSLGSVIKLFTPNNYYTDEYNHWIQNIPQHILELVFIVKRFSRHFKDDNWQKLFSVDKINGQYGNELRYNNEKLFEHYLRVGFDYSNHWRLFSLRDDFVPSEKFQLADDITSTTTIPSSNIPWNNEISKLHPSVKIVHNCEYRLYQRPDEAIIPGYDPESEYDMTRQNVFTCNFKPLTKDDVRKMIQNRIVFEKYSYAMKKMLSDFVAAPNAPKYIVCPSELRTMPNGNISKNQRYLQNRNDICNTIGTYLTTTSTKLWKKFPGDLDVTSLPVNSILSGRRNNPPEDGVQPLCVYNPLHFMDTPELFLEYMTSVTGKSPSTTGAGMEGAMTKGPFNCLNGIHDLNSALLSFILTNYSGFLSAAGFVGPHFKIEHDITYLVPEIWCRMKIEERDPKFLIANGFLEKCKNFEFSGKTVEFERMGYRINKKFIRYFAGRVFIKADSIFSDRMLCPETQDMEIFANSMSTIVDAHKRSASLLIDSGGLELAIPPLRALLIIARDGQYNGMNLNDESFRKMFRRENVINSEWYISRLKNYQNSQIQHLSQGLKYVQNFRMQQSKTCTFGNLDIEAREKRIQEELTFIRSETYFNKIVGTLGK